MWLKAGPFFQTTQAIITVQGFAAAERCRKKDQRSSNFYSANKDIFL